MESQVVKNIKSSSSDTHGLIFSPNVSFWTPPEMEYTLPLEEMQEYVCY